MELTNFINKYSKNILNIAIIIVALFIANNIYKSQARITESLEKKRDVEIKKNTVLTNISKLKETIAVYKNNLVKKDESLIINTVSNIAKECDVNIISIRPQQERVYPTYIQYPLDLAVNADDYHAIGRFIAGLESHKDIYIIDSINITSFYQTEPRAHKLTVDLKLNTISFAD